MALSGGKGGGNSALAAKPNLLSALRVQTSSYGQVIPILYGQNRIAARLIWAGDFASIPHTSTTKVGGKGLGSGGGNAIANTTYTYQTAVAMALCQGPIQNLHNVWDTKGRLTLISATVPFTVPGGGGSTTVTPPGSGIFHSHKGVSRADAFSFLQNDFGSDGSTTFSGTQATPMTQVGSSPGVGQFTQSGAVFTFSAADAGKQVTITYVYSVPDSNSNGQPQQKLSLTLFLGSRPQTAWSYLTSQHPGQDLGYNGIAYVAASAMDLGTSGALPNLSFEVLGILPFGAGIPDAEPSAIIADLLANQFYAMAGVVASGDLTQYRNFCTANGLFLSPVLDAQKAASAWIQEILDITNAAAVWSEGVLKIIPYGDTTAVGNGATFIPNTTPIYDLTTSDLLTPVLIKRPSVADVMNSVSVEFSNRVNDYNIEIAEDKDDAMIALYGLRKDNPKQAHSITTTTVAKFAANLLRKRSVEIRATYTFTLGWQFNLLEPMDLVTLTIPELGYNKKPMRITAMREDDTGQIQIDAEDFPWGTATPTLYPHQPGTGFVAQANSDPGAISTPIIFEANDRLSLTGNYEVWLGACGPMVAITAATNATPIQITASNHGYRSGQKVTIAGVLGNTAANGTWTVTQIDSNTFTLNGSIGSGAYTSGGVAVNQDWGGAHVWVSPDNSNYVQIGTMYGPSRMGVLTAQLVSSADPDTTHTLAVDVTQSTGILNGGSASDADNFRTLCYVDRELISFQAATLTSAYHYNLATRLRRGVFGSLIGTHNIGSVFLRLDDGVFVWEADPTLVGTTIWFKFTSFNRMGLMEQSLANATAYSFAFNGTFGNIGDAPANNATVDSTFISGTADNIRIYGASVGSSYTAWKRDQTTRTIPAQTLTLDNRGTAIQISTNYWVSYDFNQATHVAWINLNDYVQAIGRGQMRIGLVGTVSAAGSGGSTGGQGTSGGGGSGAPGRPLPGL
jgi:Putative phage tail protein